MAVATDERKLQTPKPAAPKPHLYQLLRERAERFPNAIALGAKHGLGWQSLNSGELLALVDGLAAELAQRGLTEGDRVILWLPNNHLAPVYYFAAWKLGAVVVPFDREMNPTAGAQILDLVQPRLVLGGYGEQPAWAETGQVIEIWEPGPARSEHGRFNPPSEELAAIYFTSGTTGQPKGCMISHANLCSQIAVLQANIPLDGGCRLASILPLSHLFELTCGLLYPLAAGAAIHYVPSRRGRDVVRVLSEQRVTHMIAVPQLLGIMRTTIESQLKAKLPALVLRAMLKLADQLPMPARRRLFRQVHLQLGGELRLIAAGGAALDPATQRFWERLGVRVVLGYGCSECSPVVACSAPDGSTPPGSVGRPLHGVQVRLTGERELEVRGSNVMGGYYGDPERTAEVLHEGWYATGDLASIDAAGNITLTGRAKDLIVLPSGMNVWPSDVEDALCTDFAVRDAAVIGVPTPNGGLALHAYLIPRLSPREDAKEVAARCNRRLAVHQRVNTASWWPEADFPRTSTLKVRRHMLPAPAAATEPAVSQSVAAPLDDAVLEALAAAAHTTAIQSDQTLSELGLDSLALVELAVAIEDKTGVSVEDGILTANLTVAQLRDVIEGPARPDPRGASMTVPAWPYLWRRSFAWLSSPLDLLYCWMVPKTIVLGGEHVQDLPRSVIFAGTHHGFGDMPLVRHGLAKTPARQLVPKLVIAMSGDMLARAGRLGKYGIAAFGLFPLARRGDREQSLRSLVSIAQRGLPVVIFPQGEHVVPEDERRGSPKARFKLGAAVLAEALDAMVVPFGVAGTERVMPPHLETWQGRNIAGIPLCFRKTPLAIAFGPGLRWKAGESASSFTARLQAACFALSRRAEDALETDGGH